MMSSDWKKEFGAAIMVCDANGVILDMNDKAASNLQKDGGRELIGKCMFDCHKPESVEKMKNLINNNTSNTYTIQKNGMKKIVHQAPWYENGEVKGLVEFSLELPSDMPHYVRS